MAMSMAMEFRMEISRAASEASLKRRARKLLERTRAGEFVKIDASDPVLEHYLNLVNDSPKPRKRRKAAP